jgi:hypothetical protein
MLKQKEKIVTKVETVEVIPHDYEDLQHHVLDLEGELERVSKLK